MASIEEFIFVRNWILKEILEAEMIQHYYTRLNCLDSWNQMLKQVEFLALYIYGFDFESEVENEKF